MTVPRALAVVFILPWFAAVSCSAKPPLAEAPPRAPEAAPPPTLRLPKGPAPTAVALELTLDPKESTFAGTVEISLDLPSETSIVWLNAKDISVDKAEIVTSLGRSPAAALPGGSEFVGFRFDRPQRGSATLRIDYRGKLGPEDDGLYAQTSGDDHYLFTQFENTSARRLMPCFDEPGYKVPWRVTVNVPAGTPAFSNMPVASDTDEPGGRHKVSFGATPPLPAYLLALVVGPMEVIDAGKAGAKKTPQHILVPRGRAAQGAYVATMVGPLLDRLEGYFGVPFPYDKLDNAARPEGLGAMENAGLIISGAGYLIAEPELQSVAFKRRTISVTAHEMAHQWFGDLVTMAWWDDVWLNEAFASWMGDKVFAVDKDWNPEEDRAEARLTAMEADSFPTARKIRQPIESLDDIDNAFDAITYQKGQTVIAMFERALGEAAFQRGVQAYLKSHAYKNATTNDFIAAISSEAGHDVAPAFGSFLDQPGLPAVDLEVKCSGGKAEVALKQERYVPAGQKVGAPQSWKIPVCVRTAKKTTCGDLEGPTGTIALDSCPEWIAGNAGGLGYYLARYTPDGMKALTAHLGELDLAEKLGLLDDLHVQLVGGTAPVEAAVAAIAKLAQVGPTPVTGEAAAVAEDMIVRGVVTEKNEPAFAAWVVRVFGPSAKKLGLVGKRGDTADDKTARAHLAELVAIRGHDKTLGAEAAKLADAWLADRKSLDPDSAYPVLRIAAALGDAAFADRLRAAAKGASGYVRTVLMSALFRMLDPAALARAAETLGTGELLPRELRVLHDTGATFAARPVLFHAVQDSYDKLIAKMDKSASGLFKAGDAICDESTLAEYQRFFADKAQKTEGGPRTYALIVERIQTCLAAGKASESALTAALTGGR